jgi:transposase-like protein
MKNNLLKKKMKNIDTDIKIAGYENIYVDCPYCKYENIFNRVSDLDGKGDDISRLDNIVCQSCGGQFSILSDTITTAKYQWFINELPIYKKQKQYRLYILNLCQAIECFFELAIINQVVDRNSNLRDERGCIKSDQYNKAIKDINQKTVYDLCKKGSKKKKFEKATFRDLKNIFLYLFEGERRNDNGKLKEDRREETFQEIKKTKINTMRNDVVHKKAYRPNLKEVESFDDLIKAIYWLGVYLDVRDSYSYINKKLPN